MTVDYTLYLCTDRNLMTTDTLEEAVKAAIRGGVTVVQLREKDCSSAEFLEQAFRIKEITDRAGIPLIINDRLDVALAVDAAGVHVGQSDFPATVARRLLGPDKLIGVSAATVEEARKAEADGADYLGVGAMFATSTKTNTRPVSMERLAEIRQAVSIPIVAIGGIQASNAAQFRGTGINGLAVVSAILAQPDIEEAARKLKNIFTGEYI
ncbi:MAG: thiamine phosphate synthase [Lachnospiraceae bacterium]|nr:thiamine phosphate synthase [Lachnospiraceae bacterium]